MRRVIHIPCAGETMVGTLDEGIRATGLLIVSGGNEIRAGAHRGMTRLAQALGGEGVPVLRYDRRGIGDSTGDNRGFERSGEDIAAAAAALRRETGVSRVVALGNCDAATALALFHGTAAIDALLLSNSWTGDSSDDLPQAAAIRARYAQRLRDPGTWLRLVRGGIDLRKLAAGLRKATRGDADASLVDRMAAALSASGIQTTILLAARDNTATAFHDAWAKCRGRTDAAIVSLDSASHSYAHLDDHAWLLDEVRAAVA